MLELKIKFKIDENLLIVSLKVFKECLFFVWFVGVTTGAPQGAPAPYLQQTNTAAKGTGIIFPVQGPRF
jgi:hypothetical protein